MSKYRSQVKGVRGWVDGGLFSRRRDAEADAVRLGERYGNPTRILEASDAELPGMWEAADFSGGWADTESEDRISTTCWGGHHPQCSGRNCACRCHQGRTDG